PPLPAAVVSSDGSTVYTREDIETGRQVWQSIRGHQLGSIWGHGAYVAPDWTADWLHREAVAWLDGMARERGADNFAALDSEVQASLQSRLQTQMRRNTYDIELDRVEVPAGRAAAMAELSAHYEGLFGSDLSF